VQDLTLYSGDPLTPGIGATAGAKRLSLRDAKTILKIPVLPISYADAEPLLAALSGRVAPAAWRGGLPITYHLGPGPAVVHLKVLSDWHQKTLYDVIARIRGSEEPDRWILRGNHHDAWVFGAADPLSGHVAMMAEARAIGRLVKEGWKPRRTIIYASWDGEEPGLLGSTEWVETHARELKSKALIYINSDMNSRGTLDVEGSRSLQRFVNQVAGAVMDPETGATLRARAVATKEVANFEAGRVADPDSHGDLHLGALGSGSDYTPFLQHLGISSLNVEFRGESDYGVYHSAYDSFDHFRRFVDPTFEYGVALAQVTGRFVLRTAQANLLPSQQSDFANSISGYVDELHKLVEATRANSIALNRLLDTGAYTLGQDRRAPRTAPPHDGEVPTVDFAVLDEAVVHLQASTRAFDEQYARAAGLDGAKAIAEDKRLNSALAGLEQTLTDPRGLPGREWYQHMIYAPGRNTGYGVKTLPGIREALEERRWEEARQYMGVVARALNAYSTRLDRAISAP
jgi:N-acetylated-alpha-linked acidic dipeptidase